MILDVPVELKKDDKEHRYDQEHYAGQCQVSQSLLPIVVDHLLLHSLRLNITPLEVQDDLRQVNAIRHRKDYRQELAGDNADIVDR